MTDRDDMADEPDVDGTVLIHERDGLNTLDQRRAYEKTAHARKAVRDLALASVLVGAALFLPVGETVARYGQALAGLLFLIPFLRILAVYYYSWRVVGIPTVRKRMTEAEADRKYGEGGWG